MSDVTSERGSSSPALDTLVGGIREAVAAGGGERVVTAAVAELLETALAEGLDLPAEVTAPNPERYVMYPLHVADDESFSVAAAVWDVGQQTPVHDHSVWGVVGIYSGAEREERYAHGDGDGGPLQALDTAIWNPGQVTVCCTSDQDLHKVSCASEVPCVGIHIYGGDIGTIRRRAIDPATGNYSWFVSAWATPAR